jgi:hypothetical protein
VPFRILIAASLSSLFPLSFQVFHSLIDGGDQFMVPLALGPSLFRSQHVGERGQQVAFFFSPTKRRKREAHRLHTEALDPNIDTHQSGSLP